MKRIFVDTSGWYSFFVKDEPHHQQTAKVMETWQNRLVTSNFIFDELLTLAKARRQPASLLAILGETLRNPHSVTLIRIQEADEEAAWEIFKRHSRQEFSYTDCCSFAVMNRMQIRTAVTLDGHFKQMGFSVEPN